MKVYWKKHISVLENSKEVFKYKTAIEIRNIFELNTVFRDFLPYLVTFLPSYLFLTS